MRAVGWDYLYLYGLRAIEFSDRITYFEHCVAIVAYVRKLIPLFFASLTLD